MDAAGTSPPENFVDELIEVLRERRFRDPIFDAIRRGHVSREGLKLWALQAMLVVRQFPRFISGIHSKCPDRKAQQLLAENIWEEHGRGDPRRDHLVLAERLARSLGATQEEIERAAPMPETSNYINRCLKITREGSWVEGMAAIGVGIEYYIPLFFGALADSLRKHYGLSADEVEFLSVHVSEDEKHAARTMELIDRHANDDQERALAKQAVRDVIDAKRRFANALWAQTCKSAPAP